MLLLGELYLGVKMPLFDVHESVNLVSG